MSFSSDIDTLLYLYLFEREYRIVVSFEMHRVERGARFISNICILCTVTLILNFDIVYNQSFSFYSNNKILDHKSIAYVMYKDNSTKFENFFGEKIKESLLHLCDLKIDYANKLEI